MTAAALIHKSSVAAGTTNTPTSTRQTFHGRNLTKDFSRRKSFEERKQIKLTEVISKFKEKSKSKDSESTNLKGDQEQGKNQSQGRSHSAGLSKKLHQGKQDKNIRTAKESGVNSVPKNSDSHNGNFQSTKKRTAVSLNTSTHPERFDLLYLPKVKRKPSEIMDLDIVATCIQVSE